MERRDWAGYNAALVRRGEVLLDMDVLGEWERELHRLNAGKEGARFLYPEAFMRLLGFIHLYFHLPYRQTEGFTHALARFVEGLRAPDYSTIDRRVNRLNLDLNVASFSPGQEVVIAVDASGIKVANHGDWMRKRWKVRRGYLKVHLAVDVKTKQVLALDVTSEKVGDGRRLKPLVKQALNHVKVSRVLADGAYDSKRNFRFLAENGVDPAIKVRKNASGKAGGCMPRKLVALEVLRDAEAWKRKVGYGRRWMVETAFSCLKRLFGEHVSAKKFVNMAREMVLKASLYNLFIGITQTL